MKDISIAMITIDRSPSKNYLGDTLDNLKRSGVFESSRLHSVWLCDSRKGKFAILEALRHETLASVVTQDVTANRNVATALRFAAEGDPEWVLFLEDDVDVCDKFLDSIGAWLDEHGDENFPLYAFGAAYNEILILHNMKKTAWIYDVGNFYGTQAFAVRSEIALDIATWLEEHEFDRTVNGTAYDISIHDWADARGYRRFLASVPSFVQHVGKESMIAPRPEDQIHTFTSWPGREWSYQSKVTA